MYNLESIGTADGSWAESVDLTRFIAADNEFETIPDEVFPDVDPRDLENEDEAKGNQFGGLETLDLRGNVLVSLPIGLRRLQVLTSLNLVSKLQPAAYILLTLISQTTSSGTNVSTSFLKSRVFEISNLLATS